MLAKPHCSLRAGSAWFWLPVRHAARLRSPSGPTHSAQIALKLSFTLSFEPGLAFPKEQGRSPNALFPSAVFTALAGAENGALSSVPDGI